MRNNVSEAIAGSTRTIAKFLIVPKKLGGKRKWMRYTTILQRYMPRICAGQIIFKWVDVSFKD